MTIGTKNKFILILTLLMFFSTVYAKSSPWGIEQLFQQLATAKPSTIKFTQERHLSFLQKPIISKGTLTYKKPDTLIQKIDKPKKRTFIAKGNRLWIETPDQKTQVIDIKNYPTLWAMITSLQAVLSGKLAPLQKHFNLKLEGKKNDWLLTLKPRVEVLGQITLIQIAGQGRTISHLWINQKGGSYTTLILRN